MTKEDWKEKYIKETLDVAYDCYFHKGKGTMKNIFNKFYTKIPKSLFKFYGVTNDYIYNDLYNNQFALSKIRMFNDPFDSLLSTGFDELENAEKFSEQKKKFIKDIEDFRELMYVGCLTENMESVLMWSYYGENHKGICVEYDTKEMNSLTKVNILPVLYRTERAKLINIKDGKGVIDQTDIPKMMYIKSEQWKHEKEWRLAVSNGDNPDRTKIKVKKIKAVYFGCKMSEENKEKYYKLCKTKKIKCYQMKMEEDTFNLAFIPYSTN